MREITDVKFKPWRQDDEDYSYRCCDCKALFNEPDIEEYTQWHGDHYYEPMQEWHCPECGSDYIEELGKCAMCDANKATVDDVYCEDCARILSELATLLQDTYHITYDHALMLMNERGNED